MKYRILLALFILFTQELISQTLPNGDLPSRADTLRGSITPEREWWDLLHYDLTVEINTKNKSIKGINTIIYKVLKSERLMQIDLQEPLKIKSVKQDGKKLKYKREGNVYFITLISDQIVESQKQITIQYSGKPRKARMAPWDGGFSWSTDKNNKDFIATSCQGLGASVWWPCKDHMYDEPDSGIVITSIVPKDLIAVANGRLINNGEKGNKASFTWEVKNPINNYGVNLNIGDYENFSEVYNGEQGNLDMDYWVLKDNLEIAKVQFKDAKKTMQAFEYWFGPYPFYEDSYKLVEVPYLGMEHQSSVTYGNGYKNGYLGRDLSGTGWGKKFDFIIVHESGHEWFANNITYKDIADMWLHESFTCYSEALFLEYHYGKKAGAEYIRGIRKNIENKAPMISRYGINESPPSDIYYKGSNMLHTLRQITWSDVKWREMLRGLNEEFRHQTVSTKEIETYIATFLNLNLDSFFNQYLRDNRIPTLSYYLVNDTLFYKWTNCIDGFDMPVKIITGNKQYVLSKFKNGEYSSMKIDTSIVKIELDPNYYVNLKKDKP